MESYISPRARVQGLAAPGSIVLGPSTVGEGSLVDVGVIIGYPVRASLRRAAGEASWALLDELSRGSTIGRGVVVRAWSVVYEDVVLGDGVETGHHVMIREATRVGESTLIGSGTIIDGRVTIGSRVRIESGVYIPPGTVIGDDVFIGPRAVFTNDKYPPSSRLVGAWVGSGAVIGANAVILPGVRIGEGAVVAAGSVVTRDVPPDTVVMGAPARPVGDRRSYEAKRRAWERG